MKYSNDNIILKSDSYKHSHNKMYSEGMTYMHNYMESRGGDFPATIFFGLQYVLKKHFNRPITMSDVNEAEHFCNLHGVPFNKEGWSYIATELNGKLPIRIRSVPEGTLVPLKNVLMTIESTDSKVAWLPGFLESVLLQSWYPITVATRSYYARQIIMDSLQQTSDNPEQEIDFKHLSFGFRGTSSCESAGIGGASELLFTKGTDTIVGILCAMEYYGSDVCGLSIAATEHSNILSFGRSGEEEAYRNVLKQYAKPGSIVACVSDTYDIYNCCEHLWGEILKQDVINSGATLVIRLDSGDPIEVALKCLGILGDKFGITINSKGYKVLNHVRILQGDGINIDMIKKLYATINDQGWSSTNLTVGQGGGSLQLISRDTFKFAVKTSNVIVNGEARDVSKDPITDPGKRSKMGRLDLVQNESGELKTVVLQEDEGYRKDSAMQTIYENGELLIDDNFDTIKARARAFE